MLKPAVFLDRDGTLNVQVIRDGKPYAPRQLSDFTVFPGVTKSCTQLKNAGFTLVVATNQPDVGRGEMHKHVVESMHELLVKLVPSIDRIEVSYDSGKEPAPRRKPEPGMLLDAAKVLGLDLSRSWMIGDRWRDIDCGKRASVRTVFIDFGYNEALHSQPDFIVKNFVEAVEVILKEKSKA